MDINKKARTVGGVEPEDFDAAASEIERVAKEIRMGLWRTVRFEHHAPSAGGCRFWLECWQ